MNTGGGASAAKIALIGSSKRRIVEIRFIVVRNRKVTEYRADLTSISELEMGHFGRRLHELQVLRAEFAKAHIGHDVADVLELLYGLKPKPRR